MYNKLIAIKRKIENNLMDNNPEFRAYYTVNLLVQQYHFASSNRAFQKECEAFINKHEKLLQRKDN